MTVPGAVSPGAQPHPPRNDAENAPSPWSSGGTPGENTTPRLLQRRVDALYVAFQGTVRLGILEELRRRHATATALRGPCAIDLGHGVSPVLSPRSRPGQWVLLHEELRATIDEDAPGHWCIEVRPSAVLLARDGARGAYEAARGLAALVLKKVHAERLRRIDLCADFVGFDLEAIDPRAWLLPSWRTKTTDYGVFGEHFARGEREGFTIGKSGIRLDVYDKTRELEKPSNAGAKRDEEHARWTAADWDGKEPVTRVEFQLKSEALEELTLDDGETPMRDSPSDVLALVDRLWAYCTRERSAKTGPRPGWTRLIVLGSSTRRERCKLDPRWSAVQAVTFGGDLVPPPVRVRRRVPGQVRRLAMLALDLEAVWHGEHRDDAVTQRRGWTVKDAENATREECERFVQQTFVSSRTMFTVMNALREASRELLSDRDARDAAVYLIERRRATLAKCRGIAERCRAVARSGHADVLAKCSPPPPFAEAVAE